MRLLLRIFEAGLAVVALLVTHQLFWVLAHDLYPRFRCPNPPVLLVPALPDSSAIAARCGTRLSDPVTVSEASLRVTGYAADHTPVQIWANEVAVMRTFTQQGRFTVEIPLRRGVNRIGASLEAAREDAPPRIYWFGLVNYRARDSLPVQIIGVIPNDRGGAAVFGLGEPYMSAWLSTRRGTVSVFTDTLGTFSYDIPGPAGERAELRAASNEAELASDRATVWSGVPEARLAVARRLAIEVGDDGQYQMTFSATIPARTALQQYASTGQLTAREFIRYVFGLQILATASGPITPEARPQLVLGEPDTVLLTFGGRLQSGESLTVFPTFEALRPLVAPSDEIRLRVGGGTTTTIDQPPTKASGDVRIWQGPYAWNQRDALFSIGARGPRFVSSPAAERPSANLLQFARQLQGRVWEVPARLAWTLLSAIPFIGLLWILKRSHPGSSEYVTDLRAVTLTFLLFHLAVLSWPVFGLSFDNLQAILVGVGAVSRQGFAAATLQDIGRIGPFLVIGVMLLMRPLYRAARGPATGGAPARLWNVVRFLVLWPAAVIVPVVLFGALVAIRDVVRRQSTADPFPVDTVAHPLAVFAGAALVVWIFLYWFLRVGPGVTIGFRAAVGTSLAMIVLAIAPWALDSLAGFARYSLARGGAVSPFVIPSELEGPIWLVVVVAVGSALLFQLSRISTQLFTDSKVVADARSWPALGLAAVFVLLSLPEKAVFGSADVNVGDLTALAYAIDRLLPYALLLGMVLFLKNSNPSDGLEISQEARRVGALMFAFFLAGRTANLVFVPVPLLIGWYSFTRWLAAPRPIPGAPDTPARRRLIASLLEYRRTRGLVDDLRKGLGKKYADGTVSLTEYRMKLNEGERHVAQAAAALDGHVATTKERIFGQGPGAGPWANAKIAIGVGAILSIPFQLVTLSDAFQRAPVGPYPLLRLVEALLFSASTWVVIACLFGYFFHIIPGRAGVEKAWIFGGILLLVTFPAAVIQPDAALAQQQVAQLLPFSAVVPWLAYVLVLTFVLVLALIFDVRTIQACGYSWHDLIAVHGLTTISAYGSSIVIASAASIKGWDVLKAIWEFIQKNGQTGLKH